LFPPLFYCTTQTQRRRMLSPFMPLGDQEVDTGLGHPAGILGIASRLSALSQEYIRNS